MDLDSDTLFPLQANSSAARSFTSYSQPTRDKSSTERPYDRYEPTGDLSYISHRSALESTSPLLAKKQLHTNTTANLDKYPLTSSLIRDYHHQHPASAAATATSTAVTSSLQGAHLAAGLSSYLPAAGSTAANPLAFGQSFAGSAHNALNSASPHQQPAPPSRVQSSLGQNLLQHIIDDMREIEDTVDSIEIPARGRCRVYMAKYGYNPLKESPNENSDEELAFSAGDYIMVFDDIDEDGYFIGELMDGRRGYVPSNWLNRLTGEDLFNFQATILYRQPKDDESESASYPPEFYDALVADTLNHSNFQHLLAPEDYSRMNDYVDLDDVNEVDDECLSDYERAEAEQMRRAVPPPQRLVLERQLNKSILIGWLHPQAPKGAIVSYQVYVDGVLKSTVPSGDRTKALLEGVDSSIPHRISVRAIDGQARHSNDAGCTIVIGQRIPFAPSCVKASHITSDSALISWLPCNSNFHHVVAVNSVEVQTVRPGVYKHLINGLSANTLYRVWVRAKPGKILSVDEKNPKKLESLTTYVDFRTMPKSLPDPPVNVQVEAGPQRRTLLISWLPLTLNDFGVSNGCAVTGYAVFAGHKKLADIDSPTGDHALLDLADLESLHKKSVTVRTKSGENLSQDSMPCQIPDEYLKAAARSEGHPMQAHHMQRGQANQHSPMRQASGQHYAQANGHRQAQYQPHPAPRPTPRYATNQRGRHAARSLQNLESDLDSHRSSIPAIEITREASGSDFVNNPAESYSEEEFESSMRFRGARSKLGHSANRTNATRYRTRQSHSVDSSAPHLQNRSSFAPANRTQPFNRSLFNNDRDIRYFVALFDYDPSTMSPNPNAASEELAFKEGSLIRVYGDKGADGFYRGELDNHIGFVPCNVVSEITDPNLLFTLQHEKPAGALSRQASGQANQLVQAAAPRLQPQAQPELEPQQQQAQQPGGVKRMLALYDYDPQENSPNADTESEIPFKQGDIIYCYGKMDGDGFFMGEVERTKQRGLVPSNFLREEPPGQALGRPPVGAGQLDVFGHQRGQLMQQELGPMAAYGAGQGQPMGKMQPPRQAQVRALAPNQRAGPELMAQQQQAQGQQAQQPGINRPTSLSLGANAGQMQQMPGDWSAGQANHQMQLMQQQQQQPAQGNLNFGAMINPNQQQQQLVGGQFNQQQQQNLLLQQQQQQQQTMNNQQGGVLSNLLSSGKQMIGAATTPRAPNMPNQFPASMNQPAMGMAGGGGGSLMEGVGFGARPAVSLQQQPATAGNFAAGDQLHGSSFGPMGSQLAQGQSQQQQQQQQHYNQGMLNRGLMSQPGEEQGGNILNTMKNMFKL